MSEIVKKMLSRWDDVSGAKIGDDYYLAGFHGVGRYEKIKELLGHPSNTLEIVKTIQGNFSYKHKSIKENTVITCGEAMFDGYWTTELLDLLGDTTRVELWHVVKVEKQENPIDQDVHAMVMVNARGDCGILSCEKFNPDDELEMIDDKGNKTKIKQEPPKIVAKVEECVINTFDPFSF